MFTRQRRKNGERRETVTRKKSWNPWLCKAKRAKEDERGISLLEVIIAMSIFGIAAIVLLQGFVSAGKINKKSQGYLIASELAENVMEEVKSKSLEKVSLAFNYPIDLQKDGKSRLNFLEGRESEINAQGGITIRELIKNNSKEFEAARKYKQGVINEEKVTSSILSKDEGKTWEFLPRTTGEEPSKYYFELKNVTENNEKYDILVQFDGGQSSGYKKEENNSLADDKKNDFLAPNIEKLDTKENAFLIMEQNWDREAVQSQMLDRQQEYAVKRWEYDKHVYESQTPTPTVPFEDLYGEKPAGLFYDEVWSHTKRKLVVSVSEDKGVVKAIAHYYLDASEYSDGTKYGSMDLYKSDPNGQTDMDFSKLESLPITFFSTEVGKSLKNIYIFYYPNYDVLDEGILDSIVFENKQNLPINLYVVKQQIVRQVGDREVTVPSRQEEERYKMSMTILETPSLNNHNNWFVNSGLFKANTVFLTNLNQDISTSNVDNRAQLRQMTLRFSDANTNRSLLGSGAEKILRLNGLDDKELKDRIYEIKVEVYKAGASEKNYEGVKPIVTWESSKDN